MGIFLYLICKLKEKNIFLKKGIQKNEVQNINFLMIYFKKNVFHVRKFNISDISLTNTFKANLAY